MSQIIIDDMELLFRPLYEYSGAQIVCDRLNSSTSIWYYRIADIGQRYELEVRVPDSQASHSIDKNQNETPKCFSNMQTPAIFVTGISSLSNKIPRVTQTIPKKYWTIYHSTSAN